jgi:hypothetical protein
MREPLVTVVTPSYNQGRFIRATIESVLSQAYQPIEYIIMDGGSTDETASVVKDYASRVTYISEKDRGQSHAINKGFHMARGSILSWLNSDDVYLPGAVRNAVTAWQANPAAGAVYGEGYLMDGAGQLTGRFPWSEPLNLWKLTYLSDYILQQTVYFRKDVLDHVGYLDENLHYVMDWDILIRIGLQYPLHYIPEYLGCLREYPEAKTSAGGGRRVREIQGMLWRHTGMKLSPGYIVYGLNTYQKMCCDRIERACGPAKPVAHTLQKAVRLVAGTIIQRTIRKSQGLYADGWAGPDVCYMLPAGCERFTVEGSLPDLPALGGQVLHVEANGQQLGGRAVTSGDFRLEFFVPFELRNTPLRMKISASRSSTAGVAKPGDRRRVSYRLKNINVSSAQPEFEQIPKVARAGV